MQGKEAEQEEAAGHPFLRPRARTEGRGFASSECECITHVGGQCRDPEHPKEPSSDPLKKQMTLDTGKSQSTRTALVSVSCCCCCCCSNKRPHTQKLQTTKVMIFSSSAGQKSKMSPRGLRSRCGQAVLLSRGSCGGPCTGLVQLPKIPPAQSSCRASAVMFLL